MTPEFVSLLQAVLFIIELHYFLYKQPLFGWKIRKQLSGLHLLSLSINKNYKLKRKWSFSFVINVK